MILKMAMKHLLANKAKTIIIISLIGIGSFLVVAGLGVLNYATQQTKNVCINDFSGDVLITGKPEDKSIRVTLLGAGKTVNTGDFPEMPYVPQFEKIIQKVQELPQTAAFTQSVTAGYGLLKPIDLPDSWKAKPENSSFDDVPYSPILGIQPSSYKKMFDTIHVHDGTFPDSDDEEFFLLDDATKRRYEKYYEREIHRFIRQKNALKKTESIRIFYFRPSGYCHSRHFVQRCKQRPHYRRGNDGSTNGCRNSKIDRFKPFGQIGR